MQDRCIENVMKPLLCHVLNYFKISRYVFTWVTFSYVLTLSRTTKNTVISPHFMVRKLCLSSKFPHHEIRWNYGIFCYDVNRYRVGTGLVGIYLCWYTVVNKSNKIQGKILSNGFISGSIDMEHCVIMGLKCKMRSTNFAD